MRLIIVLLLSLLAADNVLAQPAASAIHTSGDIHVDGRLDEPAWKNAKAYSDFFILSKHKQSVSADKKTEFKVLLDNDAIYFGIICHQPQLLKAHKPVTKRDGSVWTNDDVEIFLAPGGKYYYQFAINRIGTRYDSRLAISKQDKENALGAKWGGVWQAATHIDKNKWTAEIRLPLATLDLSSKTKSTWKMNIGRTIRQSVTYMSWAPVKHGFSDLAYFGNLKDMNINTDKFIIDSSALKFPPLLLGNNKVTLSLPTTSAGSFLVFTSTNPWKLTALSLHNDNTQKVETKGGKLKFFFNVPVEKIDKQECLVLAIADSTNGKPLMLRSYLFKAPKPLKVALNWFIYYTHEKRAILSAIVSSASAHGTLEASIYKNDKQVSKYSFDINTAGKKKFSVPIANLSEGKYQMKVKLNLQGLKPITHQLGFYIVSTPFAN